MHPTLDHQLHGWGLTVLQQTFTGFLHQTIALYRANRFSCCSKLIVNTFIYHLRIYNHVRCIAIYVSLKSRQERTNIRFKLFVPLLYSFLVSLVRLTARLISCHLRKYSYEQGSEKPNRPSTKPSSPSPSDLRTNEFTNLSNKTSYQSSLSQHSILSSLKLTHNTNIINLKSSPSPLHSYHILSIHYTLIPSRLTFYHQTTQHHHLHILHFNFSTLKLSSHHPDSFPSHISTRHYLSPL